MATNAEKWTVYLNGSTLAAQSSASSTSTVYQGSSVYPSNGLGNSEWEAYQPGEILREKKLNKMDQAIADAVKELRG